MLGSSQVQCGFLPHGPMPLVITPVDRTLSDDSEAFATWYRHHQSIFDSMLLAFGCLLFRGFALRESADFQAIAQQYPEHAFGYIGGATPRNNIEGRVYESTRIPPTLKIGLHQEKAYMAHYPQKLAFFCKQPSAEGGETILCLFNLGRRPCTWPGPADGELLLGEAVSIEADGLRFDPHGYALFQQTSQR